ncbi:MAG TPA: efflux RND transporter periplasmic adaptor subunit [Planctomycetota bacterium]|nr:efflux RND transporter periplasmic adaptor subunit [Planctomycetota bacterium]
MKTLRRLLFWSLLLGGLVLGGVLLTREQPPTVTVHKVARGVVEATVANTRAGTVQANRRAKLAPSTGGQVERLLVKEGDRVVEGQVLLELWREDLEAQLALARSEVERATALAEQARLQAELAEREAKRAEELQQQEIGAGDVVDRAVSQARAERARERGAVAEALTRQKQVQSIEAQISRMTLRAPFAGIVAEVNGEVGEFVTPSPVGIPTPPAIDLIDEAAPYVSAPIDEVDAARVQVGMTARVTLDAFGKRQFAGRVRRIAPYVLDREKQARTVDVEIEFVDPPGDSKLLPGYSADVEILIDTHTDVVRVPTESLRDGSVVFVVQDDGTLATRTIEVGLANWRFTEVTSGLAAGQRIVGAHAGLADGIKVHLEGGGGRP